MGTALFRPGYYYAGEVKFTQALKAGKLEEALGILESFPHGRDIKEETLRAVTLVQGYRALARVVVTQNKELRDSLKDEKQENRRLEDMLSKIKECLDQDYAAEISKVLDCI